MRTFHRYRLYRLPMLLKLHACLNSYIVGTPFEQQHIDDLIRKICTPC